MERWIYGIVATAIFATLSGCGASTPDEKQIVEDLQAQAFSEQFAVQTVSDLETYELLPYAITDLEIARRDTIDTDDTVWFNFTADNSAIEYQGTGTAYYHKYTEGGWQLESYSVDTQTSKPIAPPSETNLITGWDSSWVWYDTDIYSSSFEILNDDLSAAVPTATARYQSTLTDGDISYLQGTFLVDFEYYDGMGWQCVNLYPYTDSTNDNPDVVQSFSKDLTGTHQVQIPRSVYSGLYYAEFVIDQINSDGTVSGMIKYGGLADIPFSPEGTCSYDLYGAYLDIYLDTSSKWYREGEDTYYRIRITSSDWWNLA